MKVRVLFFSIAREATGVSEHLFSGKGTLWSEAEFWAELIAVYPSLAPLRASIRVARNQEYLRAGETIRGGDELALIPPVSGG